MLSSLFCKFLPHEANRTTSSVKSKDEILGDPPPLGYHNRLAQHMHQCKCHPNPPVNLCLPCEQDSWTPPLRAVLIPDPEWARHPLPAESHHFATPSNSVLKNYELNWWQRAAIVGSKPPETMGADLMPTIPTKFLLPLCRNWMARIKILDNLYSRSTTHRNPPGTRFFSTKLQKTVWATPTHPEPIPQHVCTHCWYWRHIK